MKIILIVLFSFMLVTCQLEKEYPVEVKINLKKKYEVPYHHSINYVPVNDSLIEKRFDVQISIENSSNDNVTFWLMTCSWDDNFVINNPYIFFDRHPCDSNFPHRIKLKQHETFSLEGTFTREIMWDNPCENCSGKISEVTTTKLGLIFIADSVAKNISEYQNIIDDKSLWQIIWSNSLELNK